MIMISEFVEKLIERLKKEQYDMIKPYAGNDLASTMIAALDIAIEIVNKLAEEYNQENDDTDYANIELYAFWQKHQWIPVSEKLPDDYDNRFYMCIVENHEEDLPMFCQYAEDYGFGYWNDIYDEESLGFLDSEFKTNDELGYEKVIAWQPLPEPYKGE